MTLILQKTNELQNEKTGNTVISENVSGEMPSTGAFSNHFIEGMRKIYELEPFINMGLPPIESPNKGLKGYKRAS